MARKRRQNTQPSQPTEPSQPTVISKRTFRLKGASMLKKFTKTFGKGKQLKKNLNENRQVEGETSGSIGTTVKRIVASATACWNIVPEEGLEKIWIDITDAFLIVDFWKNFTLKKASESWRRFKREWRRQK